MSWRHRFVPGVVEAYRCATLLGRALSALAKQMRRVRP